MAAAALVFAYGNFLRTKMAKLQDKIALITGGNSGIGLASAKAFIAEGAHVIIVGRNGAAVDAAVAEIGDGVTGMQGDVANLADLDRIYEEVGKKFGHLDIVFANAGVATLASFGEVSEAHFDREFDINVKGLFFSVQKALPLLKDGGSIIVTSSVANKMGSPRFSVYSATKAAVRSFARGWANDLRERRIRVNCISPGPTATPLANKMGIPADQMGATFEHLSSAIPLGRFGTPEEIAKAALFLASDDSSFVNGIDLYVDGGLGQI